MNRVINKKRNKKKKLTKQNNSKSRLGRVIGLGLSTSSNCLLSRCEVSTKSLLQVLSLLLTKKSIKGKNYENKKGRVMVLAQYTQPHQDLSNDKV